jgi:hypothetical protein
MTYDEELLEIAKKILKLSADNLRVSEANLHVSNENFTVLCRTEHKVDQLLRLYGPAVSFAVTQLSGGTTAMAKLKATFPGPVVGTVPGTSSTFGLSPVDASGNPGLLQAGNIPSYTVDDPNVTFAASADGSSVQTNLPLTDTQGSAPAGSPGSYNVTVSGINSVGAAITFTFNVPILPVPPPPENPATTFAVEQLS